MGGGENVKKRLFIVLKLVRVGGGGLGKRELTIRRLENFHEKSGGREGSKFRGKKNWETGKKKKGG